MMLKVVIVALAFLVLLEQASGQAEININLNDKSQDMINTLLLGRIKGLEVQLKKTQGQLTETQGQLTETQVQLKDIAGKHATGQEQLKDLTAQVKNLTLDHCRTKKSCCNKTQTCPSGYEWFCEKPDMCYKFSTDRKNYTGARSTCQAAGGHLAMPKDQATNTFLANQIKTRFTAEGPDPTLGVLFGLTDQVNQKWVWEDGTPLSTGWSNWHLGYPGGLSPSGHECAIYVHQSDVWAGVDCKVTSVDYICEVKATAAP